MFVVRSGNYKYIECVAERPILFDLEKDPQEMHDLVAERPGDPKVGAVIGRLRRMLCRVCSPEAVDARAKADQRALRQKLRESGQLVEEMYKRGYEKNPERLITRREIMPEST